MAQIPESAENARSRKSAGLNEAEVLARYGHLDRSRLRITSKGDADSVVYLSENRQSRLFVEVTSRKRLLGMPIYSYATGRDPETGYKPVARGFLAYGQRAVGVIAAGQFARGGIALGQFAAGGVAIGQFAVGAIGIGQGILALICVGQFAAGLIAAGQMGAAVLGAFQQGFVVSGIPNVPAALFSGGVLMASLLLIVQASIFAWMRVYRDDERLQKEIDRGNDLHVR